MSFTYSFEKLEVWKNAIELSKKVYLLTKNFPKEELYSLVSQMRRSSVSIASNLAEGSGKGSYKEQARYSKIAFSSALELLNQLIISKEIGHISQDELKNLRDLIESITRQINSLRKTQLSRVEDDPMENHKPESSNKNISSSPHPPINHINPQKAFFSHPSAIIDEGCTIGEGTKIWHFSHIMPNCVLGQKCNIGQNVVISPEVILGNNVKVQNNVSIYTGVICEDDVFLGPSMVFTNVINPRSAVNRRGQYAKTLVKQGASIGANATIVCGNDIGEFAFIGAGAVVTKAVPAYALLVGNPAKQIGWMSEYGHRLTFDESGKAICPESKETYQLQNNKVIKITP